VYWERCRVGAIALPRRVDDFILKGKISEGRSLSHGNGASREGAEMAGKRKNIGE